MLRTVSTISEKFVQLREGFFRGVRDDPSASHGQQATMRFAAPPGAGKNHPGVKDDLHAFSFDVL